MTKKSFRDMPWNTPWLEHELESSPACPVCGSAERKVFYEDLIDNVFFVAAGKWTLHRCMQCSSAFLDPRPSPSSIGKAYGNYYTHAVTAPRDRTTQLGVFRRLRRMISNSYMNHQYGTRRHPASPIGRWIAKLLPAQRQMLDVEFRYLPRPTQGQRLLDIGCGSGFFLASAREAGWQVTGVEPDSKAAAAAKERGVNVSVGTIDMLAGESNCFEAITLSHVIEHVHQPKELLQAVQRLLQPGGTVYIDTPNIQGHGAMHFGKSWRGVEAPRHLVLFNPKSLADLITATGFKDIQIKRRTVVQKGMWLSSLRIADGHAPNASEPVRLPWLLRLRFAFSLTKTKRLEFITLTARKASV